jgi:hypothetical protein
MLPACTPFQLHREEVDSQARLAQKKDELAAEQARQQSLADRTTALTKALQSNRLSEQQLTEQLQSIETEAAAANRPPAKAQAAADFSRRLRKLQHDSELSDEQRRRRIDELEQQLLTQLAMQN